MCVTVERMKGNTRYIILVDVVNSRSILSTRREVLTPANESAVLQLWKASRGEAHALLHEKWGFSNRESSKCLWTKNWIHNTNTGVRICFQTIVPCGYFTCSYEAPVFYHLTTCAIRQ